MLSPGFNWENSMQTNLYEDLEDGLDDLEVPGDDIFPI